MAEIEPHAVRWRQRNVGIEERYTRWHWTRDAQLTLCGVMIPVGQKYAFLPETDDRVEIVDCNNCMRILSQRASKERRRTRNVATN